MKFVTRGTLGRMEDWVTADARKKFSDPQTFAVIQWVFVSIRQYLFVEKR